MPLPPIFHMADGGCKHCNRQSIATATTLPDGTPLLTFTCVRCDAPTHPDLVAMGDDMPFIPYEEPFA